MVHIFHFPISEGGYQWAVEQGRVYPRGRLAILSGRRTIYSLWVNLPHMFMVQETAPYWVRVFLRHLMHSAPTHYLP